MAFALHRAAPAIIASALTVVARHALPGLRRDELHRGPRPGRRHRHRRRPAGDDHPAARAAGDLRPLDLLAASARPSARVEPTATGFWAAGRRADRPAPAPGLGRHRGACWRCAASGILQLNAHGLSTEDAYTKDFDSVTGQQVLTDHGLADTVEPGPWSSPTPTRPQAVAPAMQGIDGHRRARHRRSSRAASRWSQATARRPTRRRRRRSPPSTECAPRCTRSTGADALVGGGSAINADIEHASRTTTTGDHPARADRGDARS